MWSLLGVKVPNVRIQLVPVLKYRQETTTKFYSSWRGAENRRKTKDKTKQWGKKQQTHQSTGGVSLQKCSAVKGIVQKHSG